MEGGWLGREPSLLLSHLVKYSSGGETGPHPPRLPKKELKHGYAAHVESPEGHIAMRLFSPLKVLPFNLLPPLKIFNIEICFLY